MSAFLTVALIHLLAVMSPGPDFAFITKQSLTRSRRSAMLGAAGIALANLVHIGYCILGIGILISQSIIIFNIIKFAGAAYLIFIGWKSLTHMPSGDISSDAEVTRSESALKCMSSGFLCNVLNPKCTLFFLALFSQVIDPATPLITLVFYGIYIALASFVWFAFVASVFSHSSIRRAFRRIQLYVERVMGAMLIALGVRVALASRE